MNTSFLIHVSRTIPGAKVNQTILSQLKANTVKAPFNLRSFSTSRSQNSVSIWGGESITRSLNRNNSAEHFCISLQPVRNAASLRRAASTSSVELRERDPKDNPSDQAPPPAGNGGAASGGGQNEGGGRDGNNGDGKSSSKNHSWDVIDNQLQKPTVPEVYPQVLALPIAGRPLFPGFYKAVVIKDPSVTSAINELMKRGQPYVGAFLLKDEGLDVDTITHIDQVHKVGVFAQITSVFPAASGKEDAGLTAVLYPHRRIKINELLPIKDKQKSSVAAVEEVATAAEEGSKIVETPGKKIESEFEPEKAVIQKTDELLSDEQVEKSSHQYATSFLADDYAVSLVNVDNFEEPEYSKKSSYIRAVTSEIVSVFKEIASLNPLFRDQIASFSMSQSAGNVFDEPSKLADFAAAVSAGEALELQEVLETLPVEERLQKSLVVLKKELMNAQLQNKISKEVESKIAKRQREYYLMEQMKGIKKELGLESDGKDKLVEGFKEKAGKLAMPETVKKVFDENKYTQLKISTSWNVYLYSVSFQKRFLFPSAELLLP
ncbi:LON-domain-containing protein [Backusella circina FSU 941]|nr:LON-domain-containing protein [Backusella circina FSU 941]